ncbi:PRAME family member 20 [Heterocephalus glaber]|uniref:PRAME family member 20 n=1 Tax=Heterocephalus glaber TaxID=10181 RepID=A0AAX6S3U0_HETGA|nr:PRAME family member 20 [Heterocephalus glaber]
MSTQPPLTLLKLATQSLLKDKDLAMGAVELLPGELFPPVFMEAFSRGHTEALKAMVLSWPFPYLPLGALMNRRDPQTSDTEVEVMEVEKRMLQAVLDGIDVLLSQKMCSRRLKLQVLDMQDKHSNFWRVWAGNKLEACSSSEAMKTRNTEKSGPRAAEKQPLTVIVDLELSHECLYLFQSYLLKWVQQRKGLVQLDCPKLCIKAADIQSIIEIIEILNLDSVQVAKLADRWTLSTLALLTPYLIEMKNLQTLIISDISVPEFLSSTELEQLLTQITSQYCKRHHLEKVCIDSLPLVTQCLLRMYSPV